MYLPVLRTTTEPEFISQSCLSAGVGLGRRSTAGRVCLMPAQHAADTLYRVALWLLGGRSAVIDAIKLCRLPLLLTA